MPRSVSGPVALALGVEVDDIPVLRGEETSRTARVLGVRGFTEGGVVHVPHELGALDSTEAAPLVAHELTHALQQRRFGAALPDRLSAQGQELEEDAIRVEDWVAGGATGPPPALLHPVTSPPPERPQPTARSGVFGAGESMPVLDAREMLRVSWQEVGGEMLTAQDFQDDRSNFQSLRAVYEQMLTDAQYDVHEDAEEDDEDPPEQGSGNTKKKPEPSEADAEELAERLAEIFAEEPPRRWFDLDDADEFEELSARIYSHLSARLRFDMLVERERSGRLMDFS
ncbi:protein of unknown function [Lentzea fradiae]|uniref:eCIS core domain-containing protein n=1 Tax=Lentzea fradiae TaxID=200378 RepID=A0A1G7L7W6_9PSEU|nr:protein of unknown function [Lentzea fradiae]